MSWEQYAVAVFLRNLVNPLNADLIDFTFVVRHQKINPFSPDLPHNNARNRGNAALGLGNHDHGRSPFLAFLFALYRDFVYHFRMKLFLKLLVSTASILVAGYVIPGVQIDSAATAIIVAIILGVLNTFARPVLLLLTLPINLLSLGLFTFIVNAFIIYLTALLVPGFGVASFWVAIVFSLAVSLVSAFLSMFLD